VSRRAITDHGIGGIDNLVGDKAREPEHGKPEGRRDNAIGKVLRAGFDRRAADAGFIQPFRIAADDLRHRLAAAVEAAFRQSVLDGLDMDVKAFLRDEDRRQKRQNDPAERQEQEGGLQHGRGHKTGSQQGQKA